MNNQALKLLASFLYSGLVAFFSLDFIYLLPILIVLYFEKEYFFGILKKLFLLNFFIFVLVIFVAFQDINKAVELFFRTNLILLFNLTLFYKSKAYDIVRGLYSLKSPAVLISVSYFTISLIEYLTAEFTNIKTTLKLRGFSAKTSVFTYKTYGNIFALMFIKAFKKADDMNDSMKARGYKGEIFLLKSNDISSKDILLISIIIMLILLKVVLL